jgi:hypothetical protein
VLFRSNMTFVRVDDEGVPISISQTVKDQFNRPESKL